MIDARVAPIAFALGAAALLGVAVVLRGRRIPAMQQLGARIEAADAVAIGHFRKVHACRSGCLSMFL